jgi:hypothetical protein
MMDDPESYTDVFAEIGIKGELNKEHAARAVARLRVLFETMPQARFCLIIGGYDEDPREVWNIPEVAEYYVWIAAGLMHLGMPFTALKLHDDTLAVLALCTKAGHITAVQDGKYTVEFGYHV